MEPINFCYWLQGYFEMLGDAQYVITLEQREIIKDHLNLVFNKETPDRRKPGLFDPAKFSDRVPPKKKDPDLGLGFAIPNFVDPWNRRLCSPDDGTNQVRVLSEQELWEEYVNTRVVVSC